MTARDAITDTFADAEKLIHAVVWRFFRQHGGDLEEMQQEAMLFFTESYRNYNGERAAFTTWLQSSIWWGLLNHARKPKQRRVFPDLERLPARRESALSAVLEGLSEEGRQVAELALNPPPDVRLTARSGHGESMPLSMRHGIKRYLKDCGWNANRIRTAFNEIQQALIS